MKFCFFLKFDRWWSGHAFAQDSPPLPFCNRMAGEPQLAASDLAIKLDFQKKQLDRKLVDLGYQAIMVCPGSTYGPHQLPPAIDPGNPSVYGDGLGPGAARVAPEPLRHDWGRGRARTRVDPRQRYVQFLPTVPTHQLPPAIDPGNPPVFFACFEKNEQPLQNLLAASKRGALVNADPYDTIIIVG